MLQIALAFKKGAATVSRVSAYNLTLRARLPMAEVDWLAVREGDV
jgi:hypothetical protein